MPTDSDELRLTVSLTDNATPQLAQIKQQLREIGGGEVGNALRQTGQRTKELREHMRPLGEDIQHVTHHLAPFTRGIGGVATGFLALGIASEKALDQIKEFATEMQALDRLSKDTGLSAAQVKNTLEYFGRAGVDAAAAKREIEGFAGVLADLTRIGSEHRTKLIQMAGPEYAEDMQRWLTGLTKEEWEDQVQDVKDKGEEVYNNMVAHQLKLGRTLEEAQKRAANSRKMFYAEFNLPDLVETEERFKKMSPEEAATWAARARAGKEFVQISTDIWQQWDKINAGWKDNALQTLLPTLHEIDEFFKRWAEQGFFGALKGEVRAQPMAPGMPGYGGPGDKGYQGPAPTGYFSGGLGALGGYLPSWMFKDKPSVAGIGPGETSPGPPSEYHGSLNTIWGWGKSLFGYQHGGVTTRDQLAMLHAGETVIPGEGADTIKKQTTATEQLTNQMKDLNDWLRGTAVGGPVTTRMGGLAPGFGRGPGVVSGGATPVAAATAAAYSSVPSLDGRTPSGDGLAPSTGRSPDTSSGADVPAGGIKSDPAVPSDILATAQHVALQGGPGAVEQFMKAQGYPKAGNWCGEFAASVVKASGGTPPKNPAIASNWRNWGQEVSTPQPGDIAVANRGVATGATGSHVTIVEGVGKGTFTGLGGNQRAGFESRFQTSGYRFFRSQGPANVGPGTGGGEGETAASGAGTSTASGVGSSTGAYPADPQGRGAALYSKLLTEFKAHPPQGLPPDAARFGITKGTPEEWARFGVSVAHAESGFNPRDKNLSDPGGSFGVFQYAHGQVPGGNAYDVDASVRAFVRDADKSSLDRRGLRGGVLGQRFSTIGKNPEVGAAYLAQAGRIGAGVDRGAMDRSMTAQKVEGTGRIDVNVNAPKNTFVKAAGTGLFKQIAMNRRTQMDVAQTRAQPALEE